MEAGLICLICKEVYNSDVNKPKVLPCGHTFCLSCLTGVYQNEGRLRCALDKKVYWEKADAIPDNQSVKDMLQLLEVRCPSHPAVIILDFCLLHMTGICGECRHGLPNCQVKRIAESQTEITTLVHNRIEKMKGETSLYSRDLRQQVDRRYNLGLAGLIKLMHNVERTHALRCSHCSGDASYFPDANGQTYCSMYLTNGEDLGWAPIGSCSQIEVSAMMMMQIKNVLRNFNFCDVSREILVALKAPFPPEPKSIQDLFQYFQTPRPRIDYDSLPEMLTCPGCLTTVSKSPGCMRVLPCMPNLHALCENCLELMLGAPVQCPLDGYEFHVSLESLQRLEPLRLSQSYMENPLPRRQLEMPKFLWSPPPPKPQPGVAKRNHESHPRSTPVPASSVTEGHYCYLNHFVSVLPEFGAHISQLGSNSKGWYINHGINQVEVFTFSLFESIYLAGLTLSTPITPGAVVVVDYLTIHQGSGKGQVVFSNPGGQELLGGNQVCEDLFFQTPFQVRACTQYTLKIKLRVVRVPANEQMMLYRGCPYDRPNVWTGSDGVLWNLEETTELNDGECSNGQGDLSGPVLRLYYTR